MSVVPWLLGGAALLGGLLVVRHAVARRYGCPPVRSGTFRGLPYTVVGNATTILFHGRGGSDDAFAAKVGAPGFYPRGPWTEAAFTDPAFISELEDAVHRVHPFVEAIRRCYGAPLLAGHSQGGALALLFALRHPELVRGVVVGSAALPRPLWQPFSVPVVFVHGTADELVRYATAQQMASATGVESLVTVQGAGHELAGPLLDAFREAL